MNLLLALISPWTIFWLVTIIVALLAGLWAGRTGANTGAYDADTEEFVRALSERKLRGQRSEPKLVLVSPHELRTVRRAPPARPSDEPVIVGYRGL